MNRTSSVLHYRDPERALALKGIDGAYSLATMIGAVPSPIELEVQTPTEVQGGAVESKGRETPHW